MTQTKDNWNVHEHRHELAVSGNATVYHLERGKLCMVERHWDCYIYHPIVFKTRAAAIEWTKTGCIAELQLSLMCPGIGFSNVLVEDRVKNNAADENAKG
jgi:hypothetical protein